MHQYVIDNSEPWGLDLKERTLYEVFRDAGYRTYLVGKWHQGMSQKEYLPTSRGVQKFFGYWGGAIDYWDYTFVDGHNLSGYDLRSQTETVFGNGTYATRLFAQKSVEFIQEHDLIHPMLMVAAHLAPHSANAADPLQAPDEVIEKFRYIQDPARRIYAAMVYELDEAVGQTIKALDEKGILENTIILFYSDNGGATLGLRRNSGANTPLRGVRLRNFSLTFN